MKKNKVQVWIYGHAPGTKEYQYLILQMTSERGGYWQPVTGGVEGEETLSQAALREATEETGLSFLGNPQSLGDAFEFEKKGMTFVEHPYALEVGFPKQGFPPVKIDPHEHQAYEWVSANVAQQRLYFETNRTALSRVLKYLAP